MVIRNAALIADAPAQTKIFYPEADETPLPDAIYQLDHFIELIIALKSFFRPRDDVVTAGNIFIYYWKGEPQIWISPDCFVLLGGNIDSIWRNNTYLLWEVGKAPDFVLEIGSPSSVIEDLGWKRDLYARLGVVEYWMFDPSGGEHYGFALRGERLVDGEYLPLDMGENADGGVWGYSAVLGLEFHWEDGRLRFYDPVGARWLENMEETGARAEFERVARANAQAERDAAQAERDAAEDRAERLEAELRRLRDR